MYGLITSSTIQNVLFKSKLIGNGSYNLNNILTSPFSSTLLKAFTAIDWLLLPKFKIT